MKEVRVLEDATALARAGAEEFARLADEALAAHDAFSVALAGGSTPRALYALLADPREPFFAHIDWRKVLFLFGDERAVPPDHAESNYRMACETLLSKIPVRAGNVVRFHAEGDDPQLVARSYETELRRALRLAPGEVPRLDLILLGMGKDGHTLSWFPGSEVLHERTRLAAAVWVGAMKTYRYTLTPPVVERAGRALFLVSGAEKRATLREVLLGEAHPELLPAQAVQPADGTVLWLVEREAASLLGKSS